MIKLFTAFLISGSLLFAASEKLIIDAKNFETNDAKGLSTFTGDVKLKMSDDKLNSQKLQIFLEANGKGKTRKPLKYIATGDADFEIHTNGKIYKGKGDKIVYDPTIEEYTIIGNGYINEITEERELFGEKIYINKITGDAKVSGSSKKPVRFIINIESGEEK